MKLSETRVPSPPASGSDQNPTAARKALVTLHTHHLSILHYSCGPLGFRIVPFPEFMLGKSAKCDSPTLKPEPTLSWRARSQLHLPLSFSTRVYAGPCKQHSRASRILILPFLSCLWMLQLLRYLLKLRHVCSSAVCSYPLPCF